MDKPTWTAHSNYVHRCIHGGCRASCGEESPAGKAWWIVKGHGDERRGDACDLKTAKWHAELDITELEKVT